MIAEKKPHHSARCETCGVLLRDCFCAEIPNLTVKTKIVVVRHWREELTSSNSARLLPMMIPSCEIHRRGGKVRFDAEKILAAAPTPLFLFPDEGALELNADFLRKYPGPHTLVVPDGTWSQVRRVHRREVFLSRVPTVKLTEADIVAQPTIYSLRHTDHPYALSTFEAVARALGVLEGKDLENALMKVKRSFYGTG